MDSAADLTPAMKQLSTVPQSITILDLPEEILTEICEWLDLHPEEIFDWADDGHICCSIAGVPYTDRAEGIERISPRRHQLLFGSCCKLIRQYVLQSTFKYLRFYLCGPDLKGIERSSDEARDAVRMITLYRDVRQHSKHKRSFNIPTLIQPFRNLSDLEITWATFDPRAHQLADFKAASDKAVTNAKTVADGKSHPILKNLTIQMVNGDMIVDRDNALKVEQMRYLLQQIDTSQIQTFDLELEDMNRLHRSDAHWRYLSESLECVVFPALDRLSLSIEMQLDDRTIASDLCDQLERLLCAFHGGSQVQSVRISVEVLDDIRHVPSLWVSNSEYEVAVCEMMLPTASRLVETLNALRKRYPQITHFVLDVQYRMEFSTAAVKFWTFEYPIVAPTTVVRPPVDKRSEREAVEVKFMGDDMAACFTIYREVIWKAREQRRETAIERA